MLNTVVTLAAAILACTVVMVVGTPVAARFARPQRWRKLLAPSPRERDDVASPAPSFQPLDLGPDPMRWPSETPWKVSGRAELPWPSQTWDDPHFGKRPSSMMTGTDADYEAVQDARRAQSKQLRDDDDARRARGKVAQPAPRKPREAQREDVTKRAKQEMRAIRERATELQDEVWEQVGKQVRTGAKNEARQQTDRALGAIEQRVGAGLDLPTAQELEALVASVGLAGTVQEIMKRTGWDFKTAAQHLASARRGR